MPGDSAPPPITTSDTTDMRGTIDTLFIDQAFAFASLRRSISFTKQLEPEHRVPPILSSRTELLDKYWADCVNIDRLIRRNAVNSKDRYQDYFKEEQFEMIEVEYIHIKDQIALWHHAATSANTTHHQQQPNVLPPRSELPQTGVKLPKLSLLTFSGKFTEWAPFKDSFRALIQSNASLKDVEKLYYLKSSVTGEAEGLIRHIQLTNGNFTIAWELLENRFSNKRAATSAHFSEIFQTLALKKESAANLLNFRNVVKRNLEALKNLNCPVEHYGAILIHLLTEKLDQRTQRDWELSIASTSDNPSYETFDKFLVERIRVLENLDRAEAPPKCTFAKPHPSSSQLHTKANAAATRHVSANACVVDQSKNDCRVCNQNHRIYQCTKFKGMPVSERTDHVRMLDLCTNCLRKGHKQSACSSSGTCRQCNQKHHTLLHREVATGIQSGDAQHQTIGASNSSSPNPIQTHTLMSTQIKSNQVLLATVRVWVSTRTGQRLPVRALLDQGSTWSFVSNKLANLIGTQRSKVTATMSGLGGSITGSTSNAIQLILSNQTESFFITTQALILPTITSYTMMQHVSLNRWPHLECLQLADDLTSNEEIHLLIGADLYGDIILNEVRKGQPGHPVAQQTVFGWVISGPTASLNDSPNSNIAVHHATNLTTLEASIRKFWEIEDLPSINALSPDEALCESHFVQTHSRTQDGRYMVRIPFKFNDIPQVGHSRHIAERLLKRTETRIAKNPSHQVLYTAFMDEYLSLNHMSPVSSAPSFADPMVYLPHHPVFREHSQTTKLRVVFNASSQTSNGRSINDFMLIGPKLQSELCVVLSQWRMYPYVFTADIAKMYRQISIDPRDRDYQRILWRREPHAPVTDYQLNTITYGTRSAPYLALRVLKQLVDDEGTSYPLASTVLSQDTYVDDLLFGAFNEVSAVQTRNEVISLLHTAKLEPRKWASNDSNLIKDIDPTNHGLAWAAKPGENADLKVLGIQWNPVTDSFTFSIKIALTMGLTKRYVLSLLSQLFDPLGWVAPVIVKGKILMQKLWLTKLSWDEELSPIQTTQWENYFLSLPDLEYVNIPRWNGFDPGNESTELHGFADASMEAYGAVVYLRSINSKQEVYTALIISKTKVAPLKQLPIHRLELQAAVLLAQLVSALRQVRTFTNVPVQCWTDSSITISWLRKHASTWKLFISNRVAEIHELLPNHQWKHVPTKTNPADLASRGCSATELTQSSLWWTGPDWLRQSPTEWPNEFPDPPSAVDMERKPAVHHVSPNSIHTFDTLLYKTSSWEKAVRIAAYILRYVNTLRARMRQRLGKPLCAPHTNEHLNANELTGGRIFLFKLLQQEMFPVELGRLKNNSSIPSKSKLLSLNPILEASTGLMRVGGRLGKASLSYESKHPLILQSHPLVTSLIRHVHQRCLHGGLKLTLSTLRQTVWLVNPRPAIKSVIFKCIICTTIRGKLSSQLMADLPKYRVTRSDRAFVHTGIDYAGPLQVRMDGGRGNKSRPCYIAVFICLSVKAIHLELVSDYSTPAFIAAYKRFSSRRGLPTHLHSDRGTTFQGADRLLQEEFLTAVTGSEFQNVLAKDNVTWHFIPPAAPHFGGLWEAGVKSVKSHLKRILLNQTPTYEELTTLLCQIEAVLNSRPLEPLNDDIDDLSPLTPGHFLIGGPMISLPQSSVLEVNVGRLSRWQQQQHRFETFWERWSRDYMQSLQHRTKWRMPEIQLKRGHMVLLRKPNQPPSKWNLARVIECYPGSDGHVRVAKVKTANADYVRPISELVLLPIDLNPLDGSDKQTPPQKPVRDT